MTSQHDMAVDYFRAVLVSDGVLPVRDEYMARLERWIEHKTAAIEDLEDRRLITTYARWDRIAHISGGEPAANRSPPTPATSPRPRSPRPSPS
ncbi:hypothetical protein ACFRQM_45975 [Streptomyces sp. NPDC056831]|uniref:hypothetical protein n=1 Tax=Streptomyces sp. NPDC056831 TaxID=3345954 RepID=UPI0036769560